MSSVDDTLSRPAQLGGVGVNRWVGGGAPGPWWVGVGCAGRGLEGGWD